VITAMPRPRPPHLVRETTRHGKVAWYVRRGVNGTRGARIRLRGEFGSVEFLAEYQAALTAKLPTETAGAKRPTPGTLAWLIARYRDTVVWQQNLSAATRRQRENIFLHVIESAGDQPVSKITQATITAGRDRRAAQTPAQARNFLDALRGLFRWAREAGHVATDPTAGVRNPKRKAGPGFRAWTEDDVVAYERRWPLGTRQRVWLDVLLYTGLRRGDAVRLGRQHVRGGVAVLTTEKSQGGMTVTLPILRVLAETLAAGPCGDLSFIVGGHDCPMSKESFGNAFRVACDAAGVKGSAHGVRKIAATRAANKGATVAELEAIFGWRGGTMASLYTREADRRRLALGAMYKLEGQAEGAAGANDLATSMPAPTRKVRAPAAKDQ
jgi:integrase